MSDTRRLALELHEIRQLALSHATNPQFGNSSVDGEGLSFRDGDGNEIGRIGGGDRGMEVEYTQGPKPPMPSTPIVTADANLLLVQWDGQWAGGNEDGDAVADPDLASQSGLDRVEVHASMEPTFVPDPILSFAGVLPVTPEGGAHTVGPLAEAGDYYVVLMARGKDGQYSAPSQRVHVVTTVGLMENELFDLALRADEARESADGKNTVHYGEEPTPPDGGFVEGDLWFDTVEDPETGFRKNMPHLWDPSANGGEGGWVSVRDGRFETVQDAIDDLDAAVEQIIETPGGVTLYYQPSEPSASTTPPPKDGDTWFRTASGGITGHFERVGGAWVEHKITDEVIANLHAGKITSGFIDAARIAAGSVAADKVLIGSGGSLIPWSQVASGLSYAPHVTTAAATASLAPADPARSLPPHLQVEISAPGSHAPALSLWSMDGQKMPVEQDTEYVLQATVYSDTGSTVQIALYGYDHGGSSTGSSSGIFARSETVEVGTDPVTVVARGRVPAGSFYAVPFLRISGPSVVGLTSPDLRKATGSVLIENGAVTAEKIAVGAITAESGIIGSLDAGVITTGELRGELIRAQSIAGEKLAVDAIDGKTITGATIRTSAAGARVEMDSTGLFVKNSLGANTVSMTNGTLSMQGGTITGGTIRTNTTGARVQMDESGLRAWNPSNEETFSVDANTGMVESRGALYTGAPGTVRAVLAPGLFDNVTISDPSDGSAVPATGAGMLLGDDPARGSQIYHAKSTVFGKEFDSLTILGPSASSSQESIVFARGTINATAVSTSGTMWSQIRTMNHGSYMFTRSQAVSAEVGASQSRAYLYANTGDTRVASIDVGNSYAAPKDAIEIKANGGISLESGGDLSMSMGRWAAPNINSGSGTDLIVTSQNFIGKKSSSRRYKIAEEPIGHTLPGVEDALLGMEVKTWFDRRSSERLADAETEKANGIVPLDDLKDVDPLRRIPGVVAEDLDAAGLGMFVVYNDDGSPESVMYDRLGVALVPAVKSLRDRVNELERMMGEMASA